MNITREQMLERIREWKGAFDTHPDKMDEWSLCFMEDYKVYDAIRSLIEASGDKANENKGAEKVLESGPHAEEPLVKPAAPPSPAPSPGPLPTPTIKKDLTVEVEEAMETLTMLVKVDGDVLENAALAVIRAALSKGIEVEP